MGCAEDDVLEAVWFVVAVPFRVVVVLEVPTNTVSVADDVVVALLGPVLEDAVVLFGVANILERSVTVA